MFIKLELNYVNICCVNHEILPIDANMKRIGLYTVNTNV